MIIVTTAQLGEVAGGSGLLAGFHWSFWLVLGVVAVLLLWALVQAFREPARARAAAARERDAEQRLRDRFARGDLSEAELVERLKRLHGSGSASQR